MTYIGTVTAVEVTPVGSSLITDAAADALTLEVEDNLGFVAGTAVTVTAGDATVTATVAANPPVGDVHTVTLTAALGVPAEAYDAFLAPAPARQVTVALVDEGLGGEPLPCVVIHTLQDALPAGPREPGTGETVEYARDSAGQLQVTNIVDKATVRDLTGAEGIPEPAPTVAPAAPTDLTAVPKAHTDRGLVSGRFVVTWSAVTTDASGTAIGDVRGYDVNERLTNGQWRSRGETSDTTMSASPYEPGSTWQFRVRAIRQDGTVGAWSSTATATALAAKPPAVSPTPTVTEGPAAAVVEFAMASDTRRYELHAARGTDQSTPPADPPSASTLVTEDATVPTWVFAYPDGTQLPAAAVEGSAPLDPPAWFAVVATNGDGLAAAPSAWVQGRAGQVPAGFQLLLAGDIIASRLNARELVGVTLTAPNIRTSATPDVGIKIDTEGVRSYGPGGKIFLNVQPNKGVALLDGEFQGRKVTVSGEGASSSFGGETEWPVRGVATMKSATGAPNAGPALNSAHTSRQFTDDGLWGARHGWSTDGTDWFTVRQEERDGPMYAERWSGSTGERTGTMRMLDPTGTRRVEGSVYAEGFLYVLDANTVYAGAQPRTRFSVKRVPSNFPFSSTETVQFYKTVDFPNHDMLRYRALGYDKFNSDAAKLFIFEPQMINTTRSCITRTSLEQAAPWTSLESADNQHIAADAAGAVVTRAARTDYGDGVNRLIVPRRAANTRTVIVKDLSLVGRSQDTWDLGAANIVGMAILDSTNRYVSMDGTGVMRTYEPWAAQPQHLAVGATFAKGTTTVPSKQTVLSKPSFITLPARARLSVAAPSVPPNAGGADDPDAVRTFIAPTTLVPDGPESVKYTEPARTAYRLLTIQGTAPTPFTVGQPLPPTTGEQPPATASFAASVPFVHKAQAGDFWVDGNSNGDPGSGTFFSRIMEKLTAVVGTANSGLRAAIVNATRPPGEITAYGGGTVPAGWLLCDGRAVAQADYPALFAAVQHTYLPAGTAQPASTFYLPDAVRRVLVGAGSGIALGRTEGVADPGARSFAHAHGVSTGGQHSHTVTTATNTTTGGTATRGSTSSTGSDGGHNHGGSTSMSSYNDIPSLAVLAVIKT